MQAFFLRPCWPNFYLQNSLRRVPSTACTARAAHPHATTLLLAELSSMPKNSVDNERARSHMKWITKRGLVALFLKQFSFRFHLNTVCSRQQPLFSIGYRLEIGRNVDWNLAHSHLFECYSPLAMVRISSQFICIIAWILHKIAYSTEKNGIHSQINSSTLIRLM